jgi:predicted dehydrogenase/threonine dehydrogenase-like Zn-dependent dehydrogenase
MKQVLQDLNHGHTLLALVPTPATSPGALTIATRRSLVSLGTERMLTSFGRANWLQKARQEPERALQVLHKVKTDGLLPTLDAVRAKLTRPIPMGYCNAGVVIEVGPGCVGFNVGDRVLSNGPHAEVVSVPVNLCARIPDEVSDDDAPFAVIGAIALQGIRLIEPTLGERVLVTGLGLVGLLAVQLLQAHGARVLGADVNPERCRAAEALGAKTVVLAAEGALEQAVAEFTAGAGIDAALLAASTDSSEPVNQAARVCRKRGRIVQVGATGLQLERPDFYAKEVSLQVSCSYGPGRYDADYEQRGHDYPMGYVRWTEQRNFQAVLEQMALGHVRVRDQIAHRYAIDDAARAYDIVAKGGSGAVMLEYTAPVESFGHASRRVNTRSASVGQHVSDAAPDPSVRATPRVVLGLLGAGNYAIRTLLPALNSAAQQLGSARDNGLVRRLNPLSAPASETSLVRRAVVSRLGVSARLAADKFGFEIASTDEHDVLQDTSVNTVMIASRDHLHARQALAALQQGKHVFVEKPLCLTLEECDSLEAELANHPGVLLSVGFNRRFAPLVVRMRQLLALCPGPKTFVYLVNAGALNADHWTLDPTQSAGRIVGEACHFVDLIRHLAGHAIVSANCRVLGAGAQRQSDVATLELTLADGSMGSVHYFANGHKAFPKERLTVFSGGRVLELDNFRKLETHGFSQVNSRALRQDKGHAAQLAAWLDCIATGGPSPIPPREFFEVSRVCIALSNWGIWPAP